MTDQNDKKSSWKPVWPLDETILKPGSLTALGSGIGAVVYAHNTLPVVDSTAQIMIGGAVAVQVYGACALGYSVGNGLGAGLGYAGEKITGQENYIQKTAKIGGLISAAFLASSVCVNSYKNATDIVLNGLQDSRSESQAVEAPEPAALPLYTINTSN